MNRHLPHITSWAHDFVAEVLRPGDLAVDLTAGQGKDALFLFCAVGKKGRVLAFDIQEKALDRTARRLREAGAEVFRREAGEPVADLSPGVHLVHDSHARLDHYLHGPAKAVLANLGYLPGSTSSVKTEGASTCAALHHALALLAPGGRIALVVYTGHPGGRQEGEMAQALLCGLSPRLWHVMRLQVLNRSDAPYLLVVEKRA